MSAISRRPRKRLTSEVTVRPLLFGKTGDRNREILRSFQSGRALVSRKRDRRDFLRNSKDCCRSAFGYAREGIHPDIDEHRRMAACMKNWAEWLNHASDQLSRRKEQEDQENQRVRTTWARRCRHLSREIAELAVSEPLANVGVAPSRLELTSLFRHDASYRRFFRLAQDMDRGISNIFGEFLDLPLARTFELYELWCFLRLVRAASLEFGDTDMNLGNLFVSETSGGVTVTATAVTVTIGS